MAFRYFNNNPIKNRAIDCTVRAISIATNQSWRKVHRDLCDLSERMYDMPSSNVVWMKYLKDNGFKRYLLPNECPDCYTIKEFTNDYPFGTYILSTGDHVVACIDGEYIDSWNSGDEVIESYFRREYP